MDSIGRIFSMCRTPCAWKIHVRFAYEQWHQKSSGKSTAHIANEIAWLSELCRCESLSQTE